jgi:hypothetical protein
VSATSSWTPLRRRPIPGEGLTWKTPSSWVFAGGPPFLWGQATLRVAFQFLHELPASQRASGVGTAPNRPEIEFRFA